MRQKIPSLVEIEILVTGMWGYRKNIIVPNISWGADVHECDLLILSPAGWASEVEIKRSLSDLKKDAGKGHGHDSERIRYLYFAVPEGLERHIHHIPERAGIILIRTYEAPNEGYYTQLIREARPNPRAVKWQEKERMNLMRLGCMRVWTLKRKVRDLKNNSLPVI